jgi:hypothetical protein
VEGNSPSLLAKDYMAVRALKGNSSYLFGFKAEYKYFALWHVYCYYIRQKDFFYALLLRKHALQIGGMVMTKSNYPKLASIFVFSCLLFLTTSPAKAIYLVFPNDPFWTSDDRDSAGTARISKENPRGYIDNNTWIEGNASLSLTTSGSGDDWAFYTRYAGEAANSWDGFSAYGSLKDIYELSFDWYKVAMPITYKPYLDDYWGAPWRAQTPVLRLLIQDGGIISELVWEKWYTDATTAVTGLWNHENLIGQNFWRHLISYDEYTIADGSNISPYEHYQELMTFTSSGLTSNTVNYPYSSEAVIYGLSVGVGSAWYDSYSAYVDNIFLSFNNFNPDGSVRNITTALNDNFELPVPEPATLLLFGSGMGVMAFSRKWRKKRIKREG